MNSFHEYLDDWEFNERWHGFLAKLAEICERADGAARQTLEDCAIFERPAPEDKSARPLVVWVDVSYTDRHAIALSLAGLIDESGLRCGTVCSHCPDDMRQADFSWHQLALEPDADAEDLAEPLATWLTNQAQRPVEELLARQAPFHRRLAAQLAAERGPR